MENKKTGGGLKVAFFVFETSPPATPEKTVACVVNVQVLPLQTIFNKLTWLVLGGDPATRSHRVEQFIAL